MTNNNEETVYSALSGKCSGSCLWNWNNDCDVNIWDLTTGCADVGCNCPYPSFSGTSSGQPATTICS